MNSSQFGNFARCMRSKGGLNRVAAYLAILAVIFLSSLLTPLALLAAPGDIATVAGSIYGDGGLATTVPLAVVSDVAVDSAGNIYILNRECHLVRKVNASTGIITTVAGNGVGRFSGDGGLATSASLYTPEGIAVDGAGNLYIADTDNNRIRKVDVATGIISTVAGNGEVGFAGDGGPATSAILRYPSSVAVDLSGNIYIGDSGNDRVRKVNAAGVISTIAAIDHPHGLVVDSTGNCYVAASYINKVFKINPSGVITTVAGNGQAAYSGDNGPAVSASLNIPYGVSLDSSGNIYIADRNNDRIRVVNMAGVITTVAGNGMSDYTGDGGPATSASLNYAFGVAVDPTGNFYIADGYNFRIRKVGVATGLITTVAGNGMPSFSGDGGPAVAASLSYPTGVLVESSGSIYIADKGNHRIRVVDMTGTITTIAGGGTSWSYNHGDGGPATSALLSSPHGVVKDNVGNIFISDSEHHRIRKVDTSGVITTYAGDLWISGYGGDDGPATSAILNRPSGITVDSSGNMYFADTSNNRIRRVDALTGVITTVAGSYSGWFYGDNGPATSACLYEPQGVWVDSSNNLFIADTGNHRIRRVDAVSGVITTVAGNGNWDFSGDGGIALSASLYRPSGVAVDAAGNIYIADTFNHRIRKVDAEGVITTIAGTGIQGYEGDGGPAASAQLNAPAGVLVDSTGAVYIADAGNNRVRRIEGTVDLKPPVTTATLAGGTYSDPVNIVLSCSDGTGSGCMRTYYCLGEGCSPTLSYNGSILIDVTVALRYYSTDAAGNAEAIREQTYIIMPPDVSPPTGSIMINDGASYTNTVSATLAATCSDPEGACSMMQFSSDGTTWSVPEPYATSKAWIFDTGDGLKTVWVKFKDNAGNWSLVYTTSITLDTTAPIVSIASPITGATNNNQPVLTYMASDGTVIVKVDGVVVPKASGDALDMLADGSHTVRVESTDAAGNIGFAEVTFTVDTIAPTVSIDPVTTPTRVNTQAIGGSRESGALITVSVDTSASVGPIVYSTDTTWTSSVNGLAEGINNITITAQDGAQNATIITASIIYDSIAPSVTINSPALGVTKDNTPQLDFTIMGGTVSLVRVDGVVVSKTSGQDLDALVDGSHTVRVEATDVAGNTGFAEVVFMVDTMAPAVSINPVTTPTNMSSQTLTGTREENAVISVAADTAATVGAIAYPSATTWSCTVSNLAEGGNSVTVTATDAAGNAATAGATITFDAIAPTVSIASPGSAPTNDNTPLVTYSVSDGTVVVKVDGGVVSKVSGDTLDALSDGSHTVLVQATDEVGNVGSAQVSFIVDTVAPAISIDSVTTPTKEPSQTITGTRESGALVSVTVDTSASVGPVSYGSDATWSCTISGLIRGINVITAKAVDAANNSATDTATIRKN